MISLARAGCIAVACISLAQATETVALTGRAMGTTWAVKFTQPSPPLESPAVTARIAERLEQLEQIFSTYRPASQVSRFNASATTDWIPVPLEFAQVALGSRRLSELTDGAFDATVEPLVRLWGFGPQRRGDTLPTDGEIAAACARVDYRRLDIRLSPPALRKAAPGVAVDLSSMAKGFAVDALSELLVSLRATDHLAQIGGDVRSSGHPTANAAWRTGIEDPATTTALAAVVALAGQALSTSGDAHNAYTIAARRFGHIIDPHTGRPVAGALAAVSVIADSCARSSALATGLFVLGAEDGFRLAEREHLAALFIMRRGEVVRQRATPAWGQFRVEEKTPPRQ